MLGLGILIEPRLPPFFAWVRRTVDGDYSLPRVRRWVRAPTDREGFAAFLIVGAAAVIGTLFLIYGPWSILYFVGQSSYVSGSGLARAFPFDPFSLGPLKLTTLFVIFVPVLFLPFLGREERWPLVPILAAGMLTTAHPQFLFPFRDQYSVWLFPFVFAASVRGLERLEARRLRLAGISTLSAEPAGRFRRWRYRWTPQRGASVVFLTVLAFAVLLAPWSPANHIFASTPTTSSEDYPVGSQISGNATVDRHVTQLEGLIPSSAILLLQNNLPATMDRTNFYVPGFYYLSDPLDEPSTTRTTPSSGSARTSGRRPTPCSTGRTIS